DEENREVYGKCNNPYGHGHDYVLNVRVRGPVEAETGLTVNVARLDELINARILKDLDHRFLNAEVSEFADISPTTKNLSPVAVQRVAGEWSATFPNGPALDAVRIQETPRDAIEVKANG